MQPGVASDSTSESSEASTSDNEPVLRKYIKSFDEQTMRETATLLSKESASLLDRQTKALWGDVQQLQEEMQQVTLRDISVQSGIVRSREMWCNRSAHMYLQLEV